MADFEASFIDVNNDEGSEEDRDRDKGRHHSSVTE